jgi:hypothetical protein
MAANDVVYNAFKYNVARGRFPDLYSSTAVKVMLVNATYAAVAVEAKKDTALPCAYSDVSSYEIALTTDYVAGSYTPGGKAITTPTLTIDFAGNLAKYDFDDSTWPASTITASGAIVYFDSSVPATSYLIAYVDFGGAKSSSAGAFTIQWNASGVVTLS